MENKRTVYKMAKYEKGVQHEIIVSRRSVEPRHGYWIDVEPTLFRARFATCSECGVRQLLDKDNFCPNCGAKMGKVMV